MDRIDIQKGNFKNLAKDPAYVLSRIHDERNI